MSVVECQLSTSASVELSFPTPANYMDTTAIQQPKEAGCLHSPQAKEMGQHSSTPAQETGQRR